MTAVVGRQPGHPARRCSVGVGRSSSGCWRRCRSSIAVLIRLAGGRSDIVEILDTLVVRTILPLVALIVGTAAIGSEIEDGTLVFTLVKPVPAGGSRWPRRSWPPA